MRLRHDAKQCIWSVIAIALFLTGCAQTPTQQPAMASASSAVTFTRSALAGTRQRVGYYANLNPDCSFGGYATVRTEAPPSHGTVEFVEGEGYTNYPTTNQRYQCNAVKSRMIEVFYTSVPGYTGPDEFVHRVIFPGGTATSYTYVISVE